MYTALALVISVAAAGLGLAVYLACQPTRPRHMPYAPAARYPALAYPQPYVIPRYTPVYYQVPVYVPIYVPQAAPQQDKAPAHTIIDITDTAVVVD
ncbi:Uncharacterised protein [Mycobacteroides abscessus subsp. abscessus]|uniref:hypothetical protein n=1 Tax=Mycobacteroides abscessus TaxID=36809 RepID=UPI0009291001|nr:hypothetical protein [Mycobacteroides abscessus]SHU26294.1 Uncharacterised protein [Mycobacteroides abscessus subsp. abscessus]